MLGRLPPPVVFSKALTFMEGPESRLSADYIQWLESRSMLYQADPWPTGSIF